MLFEDKIIEIINVLENDGIVLMPTDSSWCLACCSTSEFGYRKIRSIINVHPEYVLCTDSIKMLKKYLPLLHPRIETLLCFYERPLTIMETHHKNIPHHLRHDPTGEVSIGLTKDPFLQTVISLLDLPIVLVKAQFSDEVQPKNLNEVSHLFKENADYICRHRRHDENFSETVAIRYDFNGMLVFDENEGLYG